MGKISTLLIQWIEKSLYEDPTPTPPSPLDIWIEKKLKWMARRVCPVLLISIVLQLVVLFNVPLELTAAQWFWLKDPLSLVAAELIYRLLMCCKTYLQH